MANTLALGASAARLAGSSPAFRTKESRRGLNIGIVLDGVGSIVVKFEVEWREFAAE